MTVMIRRPPGAPRPSHDPAFSNRRHERKRFFLSWIISFVRPRRRLSSAATVEVARRRAQRLSRPAVAPFSRHAPPFPGCALTASSTTADWMITGRKSALLSSLLPLVVSRADRCRCQVHRSLRGPGSLAAPWPQGFDAAMSRTRSTRDRRTKNRAVVEARPGRDSVPPREAAKGYLIGLRRLEMQPQRSIGTSSRWSTCDAG